MVLFRQRRVFVWVGGMVLGTAVLYAFAGTKYEAHMKVLVRPGRVLVPVSAEQNAPVDVARMTISEEELNSEVELLKDNDVLRKVVETNQLAGRDWLHVLRLGEGPAERTERATRWLAQRLNVEPVRKTNLIAVSYNAGDPNLAAEVLRELANGYLEKHAQVRRPTGEFHFFEQQSGESRRRLEEAQHKLLQFTLAHGVVSASQQRDLALQKLSEVDGNYRQSGIELLETERRVRELEIQLPTLPQRTTTQVRTADNAELMKALKASLLDLELKRTQLLTKFEPSHPLAREIEQEIAQAKAAIDGEALAPVRDETTDKNPNYEWAKAELQRAQVLLGALKARVAATGSQVAAYEAMARQFGEEAIIQDDLLSTERTAEDNHLLYVKKQEQARIDDALDERGIVNAMIAEQPVTPALPVHSAWMVLMFGFLVAGTSGAGAAFAADYLDPAFRSPDEAIACLGVPVLACLPKKVSRGQLSPWRNA